MGSKGVPTPERAEVSEPAHQAPASAFHTEFDCIPWQRCSPLSVVLVGLPLAHRLSRPFLHLLNFRSYIRHFLRSAPPAASDRVAWSVSVFSWSSHISKTPPSNRSSRRTYVSTHGIFFFVKKLQEAW